MMMMMMMMTVVTFRRTFPPSKRRHVPSDKAIFMPVIAWIWELFRMNLVLKSKGKHNNLLEMFDTLTTDTPTMCLPMYAHRPCGGTQSQSIIRVIFHQGQKVYKVTSSYQHHKEEVLPDESKSYLRVFPGSWRTHWEQSVLECHTSEHFSDGNQNRGYGGSIQVSHQDIVLDGLMDSWFLSACYKYHAQRSSKDALYYGSQCRGYTIYVRDLSLCGQTICPYWSPPGTFQERRT